MEILQNFKQRLHLLGEGYLKDFEQNHSRCSSKKIIWAFLKSLPFNLENTRFDLEDI